MKSKKRGRPVEENPKNIRLVILLMIIIAGEKCKTPTGIA